MPIRIQNADGPDPEWTPGGFHRVHPDLVGPGRLAWRVRDDGIQVFGEDGPRRTRGRPATLTRIRRSWGELLALAAAESDVPEPLLAAVMATESAGRLPADRYERAIRDWSFGLMQTLTATARLLGTRYGISLPTLPIPRGGDRAAWKARLDEPAVSIRLGAAYLADANAAGRLRGDPVLLYAAYNAGAPYPSRKTRWGLRYFGSALDAFAAWYGDAAAVLGAP